MIDYQQARALVLEQAHSFGQEEVPLQAAFGRVLSETIRADRDYPPFERATMDGYAIRYSDQEKGIRQYAIVETLFAGSSSSRSIDEGECYKIMTGAAVPPSANVIIRREDVEEGTHSITVPAIAIDPFQNIARRGEDLKANDIVIDRNCRCEPAVMGLLATLGRTAVKVERSPKVSIITTGDEVVSIWDPVSPVQIRNSNSWLLQAALMKEGVASLGSQHVEDDPLRLSRQLKWALRDDIVILCGGVSAGDADYVPGVLEDLGVNKLFHKIAMRPGKPTWCGRAPQGAMVFALPGNPVSCLVNTVLLIQPFLRACFGLPIPEPLGLRMGVARKKKTPLDEFFPVHLAGAPARLTPVNLNGSGDIRLGRQANALALHPAHAGDLSEGDEVLCYSFV